ncbi:hypothetical protein SNK03_004149 [Fusarium graminearum]
MSVRVNEARSQDLARNINHIYTVTSVVFRASLFIDGSNTVMLHKHRAIADDLERFCVVVEANDGAAPKQR